MLLAFSQLFQVFFLRRRDVELKWLKCRCWYKLLLKLKILKQKRQIWEEQKSVENDERKYFVARNKRHESINVKDNWFA